MALNQVSRLHNKVYSLRREPGNSWDYIRQRNKKKQKDNKIWILLQGRNSRIKTPLTLTCPTNKVASSSWTVKLTGVVRSNSGSLSLTSVTTMFTVAVDVYRKEMMKIEDTAITKK